MRYRLWLSVMVVALGVAGLVYVSGRPGPGPLPDLRPFGGVTYFTAAETTILHAATELRLSRCMRERGFEYHAVPGVDHSRAAAASPYLLLQPARVHIDGYGITGNVLYPPSRPADGSLNDQLIAALPEDQRQRWREALTGTPDHTETIRLPDGTAVSFRTDGCMFTVRAMLYGTDWERLFYTFQAHSNLVVQQTTADQRYQRAVAEWAACMREAGHQYTDLDDPRIEITDRLATTGDEPSRVRDVAQFELETARQDMVCQRRVHFHQAVTAAQSDAENTILTSATQAELSRLQHAYQEALDRAHEMGGVL